MKNIYLQFWEESEKDWGVRPDGCSLHLTLEDHAAFILDVYLDRSEDDVPNEYDRVIDDPMLASVSENIYNILLVGKNYRLSQPELYNLRKLNEIIIQ
jgi:hypothetical protein